MINNVNNNKIQDIASSFYNRAGGGKKTPSKNSGSDVSVEMELDTMIKTAIEADTANKLDNAAKLTQMKELLASGQLDNIDNIRQAAKNIIDTGI